MTNRVQLRWMRPFVWLVLLSLGSAVLSAEPSFAQVNQPPRFPASETGTRQVSENTAAGMTVGGPVSAEDPDDTTLTYSLSGDDAARFDINSSSGQILTRSALDHETGASHEVTVTASDGTSDASIDVQIAVTNVDEPGTLTLSPSAAPRVGHVLRALVDDPDGYFNFSEVKWELTRDNGNTWTEINSRDSTTWIPDAFHIGARVRVAINYRDWQSPSNKRAQSEISEPIEAGNTPLELAVTAYLSDVAFPWGLAFAPDGTLFFTERLGALKVRRTDGSVQQLQAHLSDLDFGYNAGFQDLILDRSFATNRRFYTCQGHLGETMHVIAWTVDAAYTVATRVADPLIPSFAISKGHAGCRFRFGPQGYLWLTTGDANVLTGPQDLGSLVGKVLRFDPLTGAPAPDNPFNSLVYTYGHRNPQGLALRPGTSQMWLVEHGPHAHDEVNLLVKGGNYGWDPERESATGFQPGTLPLMTDLFRHPDAILPKWNSGGNTPAPSGGIFLEGDIWGEWEGLFAVAALQGQALYLMDFDSAGELKNEYIVAELDDTFGRLRSPLIGPDNALYITTSNAGLEGVDLGDDWILRVTPQQAPEFANSSESVTLPANIGNNALVLTAKATDFNDEPLTYSLAGDDVSLFRLPDPSVGEVRLAGTLDSAKVYAIEVVATDPTGREATLAVTVRGRSPSPRPPARIHPPQAQVEEAEEEEEEAAEEEEAEEEEEEEAAEEEAAAEEEEEAAEEEAAAEADGSEELAERAGTQFDDVEVDAYYASAVGWMLKHEITTGCSDTEFCPDQSLTRGQFVTFLWRAAGQPEPSKRGSEAFEDVASGSYANAAIGWALETGVTVGCQRASDTTRARFCPDDPVTRGQVSTFLYRYVQADQSTVSTRFEDVDPQAYYALPVAWMVDHGIASGCAEGLFCPDQSATRAETAAFIYGLALNPESWGNQNTGILRP